MTLSKLKNLCLTVSLTSFILTSSLWAAPVSKVPVSLKVDHSWRKTEYIQPPPILYGAGTDPRIHQDVDALHYDIDVSFYPGTPYPDDSYMDGVTILDVKATDTLDEVVIDFFDNITINSIKLNGSDFTNYTRGTCQPNEYGTLCHKITMDLSADPMDPDEQFEIILDYTHVFDGSYQGIKFRTHGPPPPPFTTQAISSVDQPYMSPGWWPCFDIPGDKATAEIHITCPDWMTAVSNGLLQSEVDNLDGTKTFYWKEDYPLYTSVLAVSMTDYVHWSDTYVSPLPPYPTMPLEFYAFPEDYAKAYIDYTDWTKAGLAFFPTIYGEYPFIDEKYGVVETANSRGSLENQTITSLTYSATRSDSNWAVIVHELAHQWWGDWVTCATWNHVWIHEGFATYSEVLFNEHHTGTPAGEFLSTSYDDGLYDGDLANNVYCDDDNLHNPFWPVGAIYDKGGWVLHMLRHMMGDTDFFDAVRAFGTAHANSTAVTNDLRAAMEAEYGSSLVDFFDQWIYTYYRPVYSITYENSSIGGYKVHINVQQTQGHMVVDVSQAPLRDYYIMPLDFTVHYTDETTETFTVINNQRNQSFLLNLTKEPDYTVFDEGSNLLKVANEETPDNDGVPSDGDNSGIPGDNPCAGGTTENCDDNCPGTPNGPEGGTCTSGSIGDPCTIPGNNESECGTSGFCSMNQEDSYPPQGNNIGDVCDCEGDFDCSGGVDATDVTTFLTDFGRSPFANPCTDEPKCKGDFNCDLNVDATDVTVFLEDFGRSAFSNPCPACVSGPWCTY